MAFPFLLCSLRGGPEPELAKRFVEYLLTEQGQSIWNFKPNAELSAELRVRAEGYARERRAAEAPLEPWAALGAWTPEVSAW